ncbi:hypothetical protein [Stenotrophomonas sp. YAU14D1_LEIMI4_1]|uniref:hypothetical protein n=1 Tax=Stenotrophomonas sp. YAU14D1_LEIMI4_1 TaxID=2072407 RepID=UPI00131F3106|nr:hypothetical protein [Stenotrophomonas sp. YAU14D1_LEIMI4_1]
MDEKIEVGYRNIGSVAGKDYHHKFILYTDKDGQQHTISGWTGEPSPELPYGRMHVIADRRYDAENPDHPANINAHGQAQYRELITRGADLSETWKVMVADAKAKSDRFPYDPQLQNSNSLADSILRDAKLAEPTQDGFEKHWAPASGRKLDESLKPKVPGLGNSGRTFSEATQEELIDDPMFQRALAVLEKAGPKVGGYESDQDKDVLRELWQSRPTVASCRTYIRSCTIHRTG